MLSFPEILVILIVAVIVLGPKRLPETARKIGRWIGIFKQASEEFKKQLMTMDRAVDDTLNRATTDFDKLEPEVTQVFENVEASITDMMNASTLPPEMTPDAAWEQAPIPGGLAPEPTQTSQIATPQTTVSKTKTTSSMETSNSTEVMGASPEGNVASDSVPSQASPEVLSAVENRAVSDDTLLQSSSKVQGVTEAKKATHESSFEEGLSFVQTQAELNSNSASLASQVSLGEKRT